MPMGLEEPTKIVFQAVLKEGMDESGMLNKKLINVANVKRKLDLFMKDEPDSEIMQVLCILEQAVRDTIEPGHEHQLKGSELTSYRQAAKILDIVLCDQPLELLDGEIVSKATTEVARQNAKLFGVNNVSKFGRRIDLIVSSNPVDRVELSTNEAKHSHTQSPLTPTIEECSLQQGHPQEPHVAPNS
ncbi:hypothetical protein DM01DRAFT_193454 [Hesseltinella vesiculosa]|uniref:Uncharacterized protein n=1 Tax=Hesseltinella vesiculosa TaxID=101127 RepID=A0A1X2G887_9FUNG|nr:hypothetical protein DM01DRAFT_193454 [Hesseltinella vesiculosa]